MGNLPGLGSIRVHPFTKWINAASGPPLTTPARCRTSNFPDFSNVPPYQTSVVLDHLRFHSKNSYSTQNCTRTTPSWFNCAHPSQPSVTQPRPSDSPPRSYSRLYHSPLSFFSLVLASMNSYQSKTLLYIITYRQGPIVTRCTNTAVIPLLLGRMPHRSWRRMSSATDKLRLTNQRFSNNILSFR